MIRDICKKLNPECLIINSCNKICKEVKEHITHEVNIINIKIEGRFKRLQFKHEECPYCQSQDILSNCLTYGERYRDRDYILCSFCNTLFAFNYMQWDITLEEIKNFSDVLQSSTPTTFKDHIIDLKGHGVTYNG